MRIIPRAIAQASAGDTPKPFRVRRARPNPAARPRRVVGGAATRLAALMTAAGAVHFPAAAASVGAEPADAGAPAERFESQPDAPVNCWWLPTPDGGLVVFDVLRTFSDARQAVLSIKASGKPVRGIFITHPHPDHVTGLAIFKEAFASATVYSSSETAAFLIGKGKTLLRMNVEARGASEATDQIPPPQVRVKDGQRLVVGGLAIEVKMLGSGESPGATVYFVPALRTLVVGDILTPRRVPLLAAGHTAAWLKQIETLRRTYDGSLRILPGHGPEGTLEPAAHWQRGYIERFRAEIAKVIRRDTDAGTCISPGESERVYNEMRRAFPCDQQVARMPIEAQNGLNTEGVGWELSSRTCPGPKNPMH